MRILMIGGTRFIGRHVVEAARAAGHDVTVFHRGRTGAGLFADVEHADVEHADVEHADVEHADVEHADVEHRIGDRTATSPR